MTEISNFKIYILYLMYDDVLKRGIEKIIIKFYTILSRTELFGNYMNNEAFVRCSL